MIFARMMAGRANTVPLSVTSIPIAPEQERSQRQRGYVIAMSIRTVCVIAIVVLPSPWLWIAAVGAIFLPYFAVVAANTHRTVYAHGAHSIPAASIDVSTPQTQTPDYKESGV